MSFISVKLHLKGQIHSFRWDLLDAPRCTMKHLLLLSIQFHCQLNWFTHIVFILNVSKCSWSILTFTLGTCSISQTTENLHSNQSLFQRLRFKFLTHSEFQRMFRSVQHSRAVSPVQQAHGHCAVLPSSSRLHHSKGTEQRFFPARASGETRWVIGASPGKRAAAGTNK